MEEKDLSLIEELAPENEELAQLWHEHIDFERQLEELNSRLYLAPEEQIERKRIQKLKLAGRDKIEAILASHRAGE